MNARQATGRSALGGENAHQRRGPADRGQYRQIAGAIASLKQQAHRVLRPVSHSLLIEGSNYCCFVVLPFI
jgi:hypothetical protein